MVLCLGLHTYTAGDQIQSLAMELRSHMLRSMAKQTNKPYHILLRHWLTQSPERKVSSQPLKNIPEGRMPTLRLIRLQKTQMN